MPKRKTRQAYDRKQVGAVMQEARLAVGLTQDKLSEKADISLRHIVDVERGTNGVSLDALMRICEVLHITPNDLLLPADPTTYPELDWLVRTLKTLTPDERQTIVTIASTFVTHVQSSRKP